MRGPQPTTPGCAGNLLASLREVAGRHPLRPALSWSGAPPGDGNLTHRELLERVEATAARLAALGVTREHRVAVLMPDGAAMAVLALACMGRACCVPLNPALTASEIGSLLGAVQAALLVVHPGLHARVEPVARALGVAVVSAGDAPGDLQAGPEHGVRLPDAGAPSRGEPPALLLQTSGSTGAPKRVPLTAANLMAAAAGVARALALDEHDRALNVMPMFHVGGLVDLLLAPLLAGGSVIAAGPYRAGQFFRHLAADRPTWIQAVPTMLHDLLDHAQRSGLQGRPGQLRLVRAVSSALPAELAGRVERFFGAPVIEIYGMSEAAGQITSNPLPPAPRRPGSVGIAREVSVRIVDAAGCVVPAGCKGEVLIRGPSVMCGYESGADGDFLDGWFRTGDEGLLDDAGYLFLTGRIKEVINRGGEKISPLDLDAVAAAYPGLREVAAFALPHPSLGETVAMAVVAEDGAHFDERAFREWLAERMAAFRLPTTIIRLPALPRAAGGKLQRGRLAAQCRASAANDSREPPRYAGDATEAAVAGIWAPLLNMARVPVNASFFDLGGDSLKAATFIRELEAACGVALAPAALYDHPAIEALARVLREQQARAPAAATASGDHLLPHAVWRGLAGFMAGWQGSRLGAHALLVGRNVNGRRPPIFWCVNAAEEFSALAEALGADQPLYGMRSLFQVPGREPAHNAPLAERYLEEILRIEPHGPWLIGGYCEGAKIAMALAHRLRARGGEVALLALHEQFVPERYEGRVAMFPCGREHPSCSRYFLAPEVGWRKYYTGPLNICWLDHPHLDCYTPGAVREFAQALRAEADAALAPPAPGGHHAAALPLAAPGGDLAAEVVAQPPRIMGAGGSRLIPVRVRNLSEIAWQPTAASGLFLGCRWLNRKGQPRGPLAGALRLDRPLRPGFSLQGALEVHAPQGNRLRYLDIDMVEDGISWFQERGSTPFRRPVLVMQWPLARAAS